MQNEDPRLTAYALGELDSAERAEVEALLQSDPGAAQEVAEMRELAALVRRHLSTEDAPPLAPQQRDDILSEVSEPQVVVMPRNQAAAGRRRTWFPVAIAACAAVLAGSGVVYLQKHNHDGDFAAEGGLLSAKGGSGFFASDPSGAALSTDAPSAPEPSLPTPIPTSALGLDGSKLDALVSKETAPASAPAPTFSMQAAPPVTTAPAQPAGVASSSAGVGRSLAKTMSGSAGGSARAGGIASTGEKDFRDASGYKGTTSPSGAAGGVPGNEIAVSWDRPVRPLGASSRTREEAPADALSAARSKLEETTAYQKKAPASAGPESKDATTRRWRFENQAGGEKSGLTDSGALNKPVAGATPASVATAEKYARHAYVVPTMTTGQASGDSSKAASLAPVGQSATGQGSALPSVGERAGAKESPVFIRGQQGAPAEMSAIESKSKIEARSRLSASGAATNGGALAPSAAADSRQNSFVSQPYSETSGAIGNASVAVPLTPPAKSIPLTPSDPTKNALSLPGSNTFTGATTAGAGTLFLADAGKVAVDSDTAEVEKRLQEAGLGANVTPLPAPKPTPPPQPSTESYDSVTDNAFLNVLVRGNETSTFSIDVDTASYSNVRRFLTAGQRPPKGAVRIEELVNYFKYQYPEPKDGDPLGVHMDVAGCPWTPEHRLLRVGLKARELDHEHRPQANLVFLIDVSGSMQPENKLPLVKKSLRLLVERLGPQDTVGIVVYAGASGTVLEPTNDREKIMSALDRLNAGGSTNGGAGIKLAYDLAAKRFEKGRTNRVILATDGDFNVGITNQSDLTELIVKKAKSGTFLTVLGFGYGNLKDSTMEKLADKGNGNYAYIDTINEGRKVLVEQMAGTLVTVAKDVKLQIEFNPAHVAGYRLIGYENRMLAKEDFNDDTKDAGEIGAGHTVTALYEIIPAGKPLPGDRETTQSDPLKYQPNARVAGNQAAPATVDEPRYHGGRAKASSSELADASVPVNEMLTLKLRWKAPDGDVSTKREFPLIDSGLSLEKSAKDFRWAAAIAEFGMILRESPNKGQATWESVRELALQGQGKDADSHRIEFLELIGKAEAVVR